MLKRHIVISYDIPEDDRRNQLHSLLTGYGIPVQYSIFECELKEEEILKLQHFIQQTIDTNEDSVIFYPLCERCLQQIERIGVKKNVLPDDIIII